LRSSSSPVTLKGMRFARLGGALVVAAWGCGGSPEPWVPVPGATMAPTTDVTSDGAPAPSTSATGDAGGAPTQPTATNQPPPPAVDAGQPGQEASVAVDPPDAGVQPPPGPDAHVVVTEVTCGNFTVHCGSADAGAWAINWTGSDGHEQWCTNLVSPSQPCAPGTACQFQGVSLNQASTCR
jgi:hypothetical protein